MPDRHVMLDLQTFDTSTTAAISSIAAVRFDIQDDFEISLQRLYEQKEDLFCKNIALQSSILAGCSISQHTINSWRTKSKHAQQSLSVDPLPLQSVLLSFAEWIKRHPVANIWTFSPFASAVLSFSFTCLGIEQPWRSSTARDAQTLFWTADAIAGWQLPDIEPSYTLPRDCILLAELVRQSYRALSETTGIISEIRREALE